MGGASAELVLFGGGQVRKAASVPVGSLKLYRECVKKILPGKESRRRIEAAVRTAFEGDDLRDFPQRAHLVCVGGTARASLRLCRRLFGLLEDSRTFTRSQLEALDIHAALHPGDGLPGAAFYAGSGIGDIAGGLFHAAGQ